MIGKRSTLLIGPLSKEPTGLSMAFSIVVRSFENSGKDFAIINTETTDKSRQIGAFSFKRALEIIGLLFLYWYKLLSAERVYLLIGLSFVSFWRDFLIIWPAFILKRRIVLHAHTGGYHNFYGSQSELMKRIISKTLSCANKIIILGEDLREQFYFLPDRKEKLITVPNCASIELEQTKVKKKRLAKSEPIKLLFLSNLIESKGYLDCLEAAKILTYEKHIPIQFSFCGRAILHKFSPGFMTEKEILDHFFQQIESKGLENVVHYHGVVKGQEKSRLLSDSHIFVLPTYYAWEGQPISILESLSFGLPIISTPYRGIPGMVIDQYNGFFVEPKNPLQIAEKIEKLWRDPCLYTMMSTNAVDYFQKNFTHQQHLEKLLPIIFGNSGN